MSNLSRTTNMARPGGSPVARYSPSTELGELRRGMDDLFNRWFGESAFGPFASPAMSFQPGVDLWETPEAYVLDVTLPGVSKEDLELEVSGDTITIKGERKPVSHGDSVTCHVQNIPYGQFQLGYTLPDHINAQEVRADYTDGILEVRLPKVETAKTRTVKVNVGEKK